MARGKLIDLSARNRVPDFVYLWRDKLIADPVRWSADTCRPFLSRHAARDKPSSQSTRLDYLCCSLDSKLELCYELPEEI
jgi:hypothetical protein